jgi:hypothetical protein
VRTQKPHDRIRYDETGTRARQFREQLAGYITADRTNGHRDKNVWRALKGISDDALAIRLLVAGISVAEGGDLGTDDDGEKNLRDQARWIGRQFGQQSVPGLKVGAWGINMSLSYRCSRSTAMS